MNKTSAYEKVAARNAFVHGQITSGEYKKIIHEIYKQEMKEKQIHDQKVHYVKSHIISHAGQGINQDNKNSQTKGFNIGKMLNSTSSRKKSAPYAGNYLGYMKAK
jgi:hypothetical protein